MFLLTVAAIWTVAAITPGPNFLILTRCALAGPPRAAWAALTGIILGTLVWGLAGWLGIRALFTAVPVAYLALKLVGGFYISYLGIRLIWQAWRGDNLSADRLSAGGRLAPTRAFRLALMTSLANPKSAMFVASLFAAALPTDAPWTHGAAAVLLMVTISTLWYGLVTLALSRAAVARAYLRVRRGLDGVAGALFLGFGLKLAWPER